MRKVLSFVMMLILLGNTGFSQQNRVISGVVTDAKDGSPLPGVTIKVKNSPKAFVSGQNGNFTITVSGTAEITFSFVGYTDVTIPAAENMTVQLTATGKALNEVVVVGYGRSSKRELTGSISKISSAQVENVPAPSFESAIQGKAPGVVIQSGSGKLGQGIKINIRGTSSITANSQPLYVIDGLPMTSGGVDSDPANDPVNPLTDINPNDIESIEILKDASASAIYGSRAANGVVLITTKKGRFNQKTTIELNTSLSFSNPTRTFDFLNAKEYVKLIEIAGASDGQYDFDNDFSGYPTAEDAIADYQQFYKKNILKPYSLGTDYERGEVNTNWQDLLYHKNAPARQVDLSFNGGTEKTRFFVSGFYNDQNAIVINNRFRRYGARFNLENNVTDRLSVGINLTTSRSQLDRVTTDNSFSTPGQLVAQLPISPLYDPETGELNGNTLYPNGLFDAQFNFDKQVVFRNVGNVFGNYNILPTLSFRSEFGADILNLTEDAFQGKETIDGGGVGKANFITSQVVTYNTNNYFTFTPNVGNGSKLNALIGMSYQQNESKSSSSYGENTPSDAIKNLNAATLITFANSSGSKSSFLSYFARGNYSLLGKYLLAASLRYDASSRFGSNNKYGWYPSASLGWLISEESFLKGSSALSLLKLRASYGLTGNAEIGDYSSFGLYSVSNYPGYPGFIPSTLPNPDLKWEKTEQADIGLEFGFLKNRISGEIDFYDKKTKDLLLSINVPNTIGYNTQLVNAGNMTNKGVELTLNTVNIDNGSFRWTTSINAAYNKNRVGDIGGQIIEGGYSVTQRAIEGEPIGVFYGQKFLGVDPANGDALYLGEDGKPTADFDDADMVILGKSNPDWTGGFGNTFSYKGFELNAFFTFVTGNMVNNAAGYFMSDGFYNGFDNQTTDILNAWQKPGDITNVPRIGYFYGSGYQPSSSRWLYDGDYLRLRTLSLSYSIPKNVLQSIKVSSARVYISALNLLTFTKYPGDPEVNVETLGSIGGGQDFYTIPQAKTITFGLNVKF